MKSPSTEGAPAKRRGTLKKILLGLAIVVVLVLVAGPMIVSGVGKSKIVEGVAASIDGSAELGGFSFMWPASAELSNFAIRDRFGDPVFEVESIEADARVGALLGGAVDATVVVRRPKVVLREGADGRFNVERLAKAPPKTGAPKPPGGGAEPKAPAPTAKTEPTAPPPKAPAPQAPDVRASLTLRDGDVLVVDRDGGETRLTDLQATFDASRGLSEKATFAASFRCEGGFVKLDGALVLAPSGTLDPARIVGDVSYAIERLELQRFAALAKRFGSMERFVGRVDGSGAYALLGDGGAKGEGRLEIVDLALLGPSTGGKPLVVKNCVVTNTADFGAGGLGSFRAKATADSFLAAETTVAVSQAAGDFRRAAGDANVRLDFGALSAAAPGLLKLKDGFTLSGVATSSTTFDATTGADGLGALKLATNAELKDLSARDGAGKLVPLDKEATFALDVSKDVDGPFALKTFDLKMGKVVASASGSFDPKTGAAGPSFAKVDADLDDLARKLASFTDLGATFGGKIAVDARVEGDADVARATTKTVVKGLRVVGSDGRGFGPLDVVAEQRATIDLRPGGKTVIEKAVIEAAPFSFSAKGEVVDARDATKTRATLNGSLEISPDAIGKVFGGYLDGATLTGGATTLSFDVATTPKEAVLRGNLASAGARYRSSEGGETSVGAASGTFDVLFGSDGERLDVRALRLDLNDAIAAPPDGGPAARLKNATFDLVLNKRGSDAEIPKFSLKSDLATAEGSATILSMGKSGMKTDGRMTARGAFGPLIAWLKPFAPNLKDASGAGEWTLETSATTSGDEVLSRSAFATRGLTIVGLRSEDRSVDLRGVDVTLDSEASIKTSGSGSATIKSFVLKAPGADLTASVAAKTTNFLSEEGAAPPTPKTDATLDLSVDLKKAFASFGAFAGLDQVEAEGAAAVRATVKSDAALSRVDGVASIKNLAVAAIDADGTRRVAREPSLAATYAIAASPDGSEIAIEKLAIDSAALKGDVVGKVRDFKAEPEFVGVRGTFDYHPDSLGVILKPFWTSGRMEGAERRRVVFTLDGKAAATDWISVLRGTNGEVDASLAKLVFPAIDVFGDVKSVVRGEKTETTGSLKLNGGDLKVASTLDLRRRSDATSTIKVGLMGAKANGAMAPLLQLASPMLAVDQKSGGFLGGLLDLDLELTYTGRVEKDTFTGGAAAFPYAAIDGKGRVGFSDLVVQGSSVLGSLADGLLSGGLSGLTGGGGALGPFGAGAPRGASRLDLEPLTFSIRKGRLFYDKPITTSVGGMRMTWNGSVGLDRTLDMVVEIPVNEGMTKKHGFLSVFGGESIRIPLTGSTEKPNLRLDQALAGMAEEAVKRRLTGGLGGLPIPGFGGDKKPDAPKPPSGGPPAEEKPRLPFGFPPIPGFGGEKPPPKEPPAPPKNDVPTEAPKPPPQDPPKDAPKPTPPATPSKDAPKEAPKEPSKDAPTTRPFYEARPPSPHPRSTIYSTGVRAADNLLREANMLYEAGKKSEAAERYRDLRTRFGWSDAYWNDRARIDARVAEGGG